jgi:hypothetical protein
MKVSDFESHNPYVLCESIIVNPFGLLYITGGGTPQTDLGDEAHAVTAEGMQYFLGDTCYKLGYGFWKVIMLWVLEGFMIVSDFEAKFIWSGVFFPNTCLWVL